MRAEIKDNFFPHGMFNQIVEDSQHSWETRPFIFLYKDLKNSFYTKDCVNFISVLFNKKFNLYRSLYHAMVPGSRFKIHKDSKNSTHTCLLFVNPNWKPTWNGGTFFGEESNEYIQFKPNRMILMECDQYHSGSSFSSEATDFRYQVVWHLNKL
tara:strand:- start:555 stop:1016 length:462 start_codon:yes stop_codon:yes gene_type:complete